jgi:hypothetical protein
MNPTQPLTHSPTREAFAQSLAGLCIWTATAGWMQPGWSPALLAFAPLVLFPLLLQLLNEPARIRRLAFIAYLPALASYALDGEWRWVAGLLALPWLGFTLFVAVNQLLHLWPPHSRPLSPGGERGEQMPPHPRPLSPGGERGEMLIKIVIKGYLVIGAVWLVLARFGERPLDFSDAIVHATAVHFHYAGFALPIVALQWMNAAPSNRRFAVMVGLLLGVPLVATGITATALGVEWMEWLAVCYFVAACGWFAVEQFMHAMTACEGWRRGLLALSSICLIVAMGLAFLYATGNHWNLEWLDINLMLRTHGPIQVFGFALPAIIAWPGEPRPVRARVMM